MVRFSSQTGSGRGLPRWLAAMVSAIVSALVVLAVAVPGAWAAGSASVTSWADVLSALTTADTVTYTVSANTVPGTTLTVPDGKTLIVTGSAALAGSDSGKPLFDVAKGGRLVLDGVTIRTNTVGDDGAVHVAVGGVLDLGSDGASPSAPSITGNTTKAGAARNLVVAEQVETGTGSTKVTESATVRLNASADKPIGLSYAGDVVSPVSMVVSGKRTVTDSDIDNDKITLDKTSDANNSELETVLVNNTVVLRSVNAKILYWAPNSHFAKGNDSREYPGITARQTSDWTEGSNRFYGLGDLITVHGSISDRETFVDNDALNGLPLDQFDFIYIEPSMTKPNGGDKYYTQDEVDALLAYLDKGGRIFIQCEDTSYQDLNSSGTELATRLYTGFTVESLPSIGVAGATVSRTDSAVAKSLTEKLPTDWEVGYASPISYTTNKASVIFAATADDGSTQPICVDLQAGSSDTSTPWGNVTVISDGNIWAGVWSGADSTDRNPEYATQFADNLVTTTRQSRAVAATGTNPNTEQFTVTFKPGDATEDGAVESTASVYKGSPVGDPELTYTNHVLLGWYYTDAQGEKHKWDFSKDAVTEDVTLTAEWTEYASYSVAHYRETLETGMYPLVADETVTTDENNDPLTGKIGDKVTADSEDTSSGDFEGFTAQTVEPQEVLADGSTVVKVYYTRNTNTVTFTVTEDGTLDKGVQDSLKVKTGIPLSEDVDGKFVTPTVTPVAGKKFLGWRQQAESEEEAAKLPVYSPSEMADVTVKSAATFEAQYEDLPDVTVVFDYNGGKDASGASYKSLTGAQGTSYKDDIPATDTDNLKRTGYTLDGDKTWQSSVSTVKPEGTFTAAATFKAVWTANDNTVKFVQAKDDTHGTLSYDTEFTVKTDATVGEGVSTDASKTAFAAPPTVSVDAGYSFVGWKCSEDNKLYDSKDVASYEVKGLDETNRTVTFTAVYAANKNCTVVFNPNGGQIDGSDDGRVVSGLKDQSYAADVPDKKVMSREGYTFGGWLNADDEVVTPSGVFDTEGVTTYTAKWDPTLNTITFKVDAKDGTQTAGASTLTDVATGTLLKDVAGYPAQTGPTVKPVAGRKFLGWRSSGDNALYQPSEIGALRSKPNLTFTAEFEDTPKVTVTFDYNNGALDGKTSSTVTGNQDTAQAVPQPTRAGYTLGGWTAVPSSVGNLEATDTSVTLKSDAVYTAQWNPVSQDVKFIVGANGALGDGVKASLSVPTGTALKDAKDAQGAAAYAEPSVSANDGWKFTGWRSSADQKLYQPSQIKDLLAEPGLTFTAEYQELGAVTATLNYNGGHNKAGEAYVQLSGKENVAYSDADKAKAAEVPTRDGYKFAGWDVKPSGRYANASYVAQWTPLESTVTFTTDERGTLSGTTKYDKVKTGSAVNGKPDEPKAVDGYRFTGWRCNEDGRLYSHDSVDKYVVAGTAENQKVTFTAEYVDLDDVQVYFNYNGGRDKSGETSGTLSGQAGKSYAQADVPVPTRTGYTFDKWDETPSLKYESVMYTAKWNVVENTVTFDKGDHGAALTGETTYKVNSGDKVGGEPTVTPEDGWTFVGWKCDADQKVYAADGVKDKYVVTGVDGGKAQQVTFTALYEKNDGAKVVFNANGGLVDGKSTVTLTDAAGTKYTAPTDLTREGYELQTPNWLDADDNEPTGTYAEGTTVYTAQWTAKANTLSFERGENNGQISGSLSYQVDTDAKLAGVTAPSATANAGYSFAGWQSDEFGLVASDQLASLVMPAHDVTMTAVWKANPTGTVVFNFNGGHNANNESSAKVSGPLNTKYETPADPTREGWTFDGWDTEVSGTFDETTLVVNAKWTEATNKLSFAAGEHGSLAGTTGYEVATNANLKDAGVTAPNVTVEQGYEFIGWQSDKLGLV
ncbi:InlB B-repeat-containing protein, partial [Bifidobacterium panos]